MAFFIVYEAVADLHQWRFQSTKWSMINSRKKLVELPALYNRGFNTTGLWRVSRHPGPLRHPGLDPGSPSSRDCGSGPAMTPSVIPDLCVIPDLIRDLPPQGIAGRSPQ